MQDLLPLFHISLCFTCFLCDRGCLRAAHPQSRTPGQADPIAPSEPDGLCLQENGPSWPGLLALGVYRLLSCTASQDPHRLLLDGYPNCTADLTRLRLGRCSPISCLPAGHKSEFTVLRPMGPRGPGKREWGGKKGGSS